MCQCFAHSTGCKRTETSVCQLSWHTFHIYKGVGGGGGRRHVSFNVCTHHFHLFLFLLLFLLFLLLLLGFCSDGQHSSGNLDMATDEAFSVTQHSIMSYSPPGWSLWEQMAETFWEGQGATAFVTLQVRINVGSWHILTFGQGSLKRKKICPIHILFKGKKTAISSELCLSSGLISGFLGGLEICPVQQSILVRCFTVFTPCRSSAWHAWGLHCSTIAP